MAVVLPSMSVVNHLQIHMPDAPKQSALPVLPDLSTSIATQSGGSKRPKLSLQTSSLVNTHGSLTRGLGGPATGTQATYTPTTTNTLTNTWDLSIRPSPISRTESPRPQPIIRSQSPTCPYSVSLPFGVKSILKNSPLPSKQPTVSVSPADSRKKVFFPKPKRVTFKRTLEDFIETQHYVARHSDLTSSGEESSGEDEASPPGICSTSETSQPIHSPPPSKKRKQRRDSGVHIDDDIYVDTKSPSDFSELNATSGSTSTSPPTSPNDAAITRPAKICKRRSKQSISSPTLTKVDLSSNSQQSSSPTSQQQKQKAERNLNNNEQSPSLAPQKSPSTSISLKQPDLEGSSLNATRMNAELVIPETAKSSADSSALPADTGANTENVIDHETRDSETTLMPKEGLETQPLSREIG